MGLPKEISDLIERFERNRESYMSGQCKETQLKREFLVLDPFFTTLGWDLDNKQGYAEAYKDVIHEDAFKIGGATKSPDYCFRIGGVKKFFVEAKKPSINLREDVSPAFQLRRYAWSAKLPLSILTDFEELAVYDCRIKQSQTDKASTGRVLYLTYKDYQEKCYGVDIDSRAVEVTKLSLLLKVLEGENSQTLAAELRFFHQRALPDLGDNIKCGGSLIGPDFYRQQMLLDDEERLRINVFDWDKEFPEIMNPSLNPPLIRGKGRGV